MWRVESVVLLTYGGSTHDGYKPSREGAAAGLAAAMPRRPLLLLLCVWLGLGLSSPTTRRRLALPAMPAEATAGEAGAVAGEAGVRSAAATATPGEVRRTGGGDAMAGAATAALLLLPVAGTRWPNTTAGPRRVASGDDGGGAAAAGGGGGTTRTGLRRGCGLSRTASARCIFSRARASRRCDARSSCSMRAARSGDGATKGGRSTSLPLLASSVPAVEVGEAATYRAG